MQKKQISRCRQVAFQCSPPDTVVRVCGGDHSSVPNDGAQSAGHVFNNRPDMFCPIDCMDDEDKGEKRHRKCRKEPGPIGTDEPRRCGDQGDHPGGKESAQDQLAGAETEGFIDADVFQAAKLIDGGNNGGCRGQNCTKQSDLEKAQQEGRCKIQQNAPQGCSEDGRRSRSAAESSRADVVPANKGQRSDETEDGVNGALCGKAGLIS